MKQMDRMCRDFNLGMFFLRAKCPAECEIHGQQISAEEASNGERANRVEGQTS